jgi:hypothetical protein
VACSGSVDRVDGWPIGPPADCGGPAAVSCERMTKAATSALDARDPGHAAIASVRLFEEGAITNALGQRVLMTRSLEMQVAEFVLADGSSKAVGVADWPSGPVTVPYGP